MENEYVDSDRSKVEKFVTMFVVLGIAAIAYSSAALVVYLVIHLVARDLGFIPR
jgi:hypothetical protein